MTARFTESWVGEILEAAGETTTAAQAIESFKHSERAWRAEYWQKNPIQRIGDERPYRQDSDDDGDDESAALTAPGTGKKALAIGVLLAIFSISLQPVQSGLTAARNSLSQTGAVDFPPRTPMPLSCYRLLHSVLPPADSRDHRHYASANECALRLAP